MMFYVIMYCTTVVMWFLFQLLMAGMACDTEERTLTARRSLLAPIWPLVIMYTAIQWARGKEGLMG